MSEPPQNPGPGDDDRAGPDASAPDLSKNPDAAAAPAPEAPADDRPPPYQGVYGAGPGQQGFAAPGPPPQHPGQQPYGVPPQGRPGYGQPGYGPPGYGPPPGHMAPEDMLAGRWARLGAAVLDSLILGVLMVPIMLAAIRWDRFTEIVESGEPITDPMEVYNIPVLLTGYVIVFVVGFAYYTITQAKWGQTLGKRACGIRLVSAADHSAVRWGQVAGRQAFVYGISIVTVVLNFTVPAAAFPVSVLATLDNAFILWDRQRQSLHDKVAGTVVVKVTPWTADPYKKS
ncbi:RDD family protein [Actinomadura rifamycini]|uniref:RDD family protein n=1 Tax=Actinomadura rifamycini TaxID=31962 RepID=UPI00047A1847|nr:RDD family protein [Actinomadura rifamycini]